MVALAGLGAALSGGASLLGGLFGEGGLFGPKKKDTSPAANLLSQAKGARMAAEQYGFNPLTMLQYGQTAGSMSSGGGAPLASIDLISGGLRDLGDVFSGEAARKRAADQLQLDLAQLKLDQLRSGVIAVAPSASAAVGDGLPPLGRRAAAITSNAGQKAAPFGQAAFDLAPGRELQVQPTSNASGVFQLENPGTAGPVWVPGDSEPWGIDELATAVLVGAPQALYNNVRENLIPNVVEGVVGFPGRVRDMNKVRSDLYEERNAKRPKKTLKERREYYRKNKLYGFGGN